MRERAVLVEPERRARGVPAHDHEQADITAQGAPGSAYATISPFGLLSLEVGAPAPVTSIVCRGSTLAT